MFGLAQQPDCFTGKEKVCTFLVLDSGKGIPSKLSPRFGRRQASNKKGTITYNVEACTCFVHDKDIMGSSLNATFPTLIVLFSFRLTLFFPSSLQLA